MKNIYKALFDFQQEVPIIHKGTQGYGYSYAALSSIVEIITPILGTHGLGYIQIIEGDKMITRIFHFESGETIEGFSVLGDNVQLAKMNKFQVEGSEITYKRRYALSAILGLVTEKDTDGTGEQPKKTPQKVQQQTKAENLPVYTGKLAISHSNGIRKYFEDNLSLEQVKAKLKLKYSRMQPAALDHLKKIEGEVIKAKSVKID